MERLALLSVQQKALRSKNKQIKARDRYLEREKKQAWLNKSSSVNDSIYLFFESIVKVEGYILFTEGFLLGLLSLIATTVPDRRK